MSAGVAHTSDSIALDLGDGRPARNPVGCCRHSSAQQAVSDGGDRHALYGQESLLCGDDRSADMRLGTGIDHWADVHMTFESY